jgi:hypothetical protein
MTDKFTKAALLNIAREGLREIGYQDELLRTEYEFTDMLSYEQPLRKIDLAAFAQEPPSYRNACIGIIAPPRNGSDVISNYRALGAPQILSLHPDEEKVLRWKIFANTKPELIEVIDSRYLQNVILANKEQWSPESVLRAKSIRFTNEPVQLDFFDIGLVPTIEDRVHEKLDRLLLDTLASCVAIYKEYHFTEPNNEALFRLIFRLIAAKLLGDRQYPGNWLSNNVQEVLKEIDAFYFQGQDGQPILDDARVQDNAWQRIRTAFSFQNLSVEVLAYVYENTLVSTYTRKAQSVHATNPLIAEFVVQQLPFEFLPKEERYIFEPFAGHAPFLVASLGRLRNLLPYNMDTKQRHDYFVQMLTGMEIDAFACEVARYSLILADYPNPNGWHLENANFFKAPTLDAFLKKANIVLCNPPYEDFTPTDREKYSDLHSLNKAVASLSRTLQQAPKMLGFVLPRVFIDGKMYASVRKQIAETYKSVSLVALPDNTFNFSNAETVLLIAHDLNVTKRTWSSALVKNTDYLQFIYSGKTTWQTHASDSYIEDQMQQKKINLWYTPIQIIWDKLASLPRLQDIADIHRGIEYNVPFRENAAELVSNTPREGFVKGIARVSDDFEPYMIKSSSYLSIDPSKRRRNAYNLAWEKTKVIANAARIAADRWLIAAAIDEQGLICYQNFHGIWPKGHIPVEVIAALLNHPIANAFLSTHRTAWHNRKDTIGQIPIPKFRPSQIRLITSLVREYMSYREAWNSASIDSKYFENRCRGIIRQIDSELLNAYNLPLDLERELLRYFDGYKRPGPITLTQIKPSSTKRFYTSIIRIEDIKIENGREIVDAVVVNWNPNQVIHFPASLIPTNIKDKLSPDVLLLAQVNIGVKSSEELLFENIELAPELSYSNEIS